MVALNVVGLSGNVKSPSRTAALVAEIATRLAERVDGSLNLIDLADAAPVLFRATNASALDDDGRQIVDAVESADVLVVGSPVYRASYTGALKHLFDMVDLEALAGKPVILAATGGTPMHGLMLEHQFRPLFSFFKAVTVPTSVYALEQDFVDYRLTNPEVASRIASAIDEAGHLVSASHALRLRRQTQTYRINPGSRLRAL